MIAGNHHKTGQNNDAQSNYDKHVEYLQRNFPVQEVLYKWSVQYYQSADNIPYIGLASRKSKHVYMATGFYADGLVYGTLAGILLGDIICKKSTNWTKIYNSNRFKPISSAPFLIKENINNLFQYYKDIPTLSSPNFDEIKCGQAKVITIEEEKFGAYRDEHNKLHVVSAICPHMKCLVNWNNAEKTWDCPCHGSRFNYKGNVLEGPAKHDLKPKDL